jgi:hypothetical protein
MKCATCDRETSQGIEYLQVLDSVRAVGQEQTTRIQISRFCGERCLDVFLKYRGYTAHRTNNKIVMV